MTKFPLPKTAQHRARWAPTRWEYWETAELLRCTDAKRASGVPVDVILGQNPPGREPRGCCDAFRKGPSREVLLAWDVPIATALAFNVTGRITPYVRDRSFAELRQTEGYRRTIEIAAQRLLAVVARLGTQFGRLYACGAYARDTVERALSMADARAQRLRECAAQGLLIGLPHPSLKNSVR